jgi:hypothetical protein
MPHVDTRKRGCACSEGLQRLCLWEEMVQGFKDVVFALEMVKMVKGFRDYVSVVKIDVVVQRFRDYVSVVKIDVVHRLFEYKQRLI